MRASEFITEDWDADEQAAIDLVNRAPTAANLKKLRLIRSQRPDVSPNVSNAASAEPTDNTGYQQQHSAPTPESGAPAFDVTMNGIYPPDVYTHGTAYYGSGLDYDDTAFSIVRGLRNRPNARLDIYRAVPNDPAIKAINHGDWVAIVRQYAIDHGEAHLGTFKILKRNVFARDIFTVGDSIQEWGYTPQPRAAR